MGVRGLVCGLAGLLPLGCGAGVFACESDAQCVGADGMGVCEPSGYCSFPDGTCASGRRYGKAAPEGIAGMCVPAGEATEPGSAESGSAATTASDPSTTSDVTSSSASASTTMPVVDDSGTTDPRTGTTSETSASTDTSDGSTTSMRPFTVEYEATIAVCTQAGVHDLDACAVQTGGEQFTVDGEDTSGGIANGWLRFDLDDEIEGADVLSVQLVLRVGPESNDDAGQSGELWRVDAFDLNVLSMTDPDAIELLAEDLGDVAVDADVIFDLPTDVVEPGEPLHLGLFPVDPDGVDYHDHASTHPPRLVIEAQP